MSATRSWLASLSRGMRLQDRAKTSKGRTMRDLIALLLFAISGYFIFHARSEGPVQETTFELVPIPGFASPRCAGRKPQGRNRHLIGAAPPALFFERPPRRFPAGVGDRSGVGERSPKFSADRVASLAGDPRRRFQPDHNSRERTVFRRRHRDCRSRMHIRDWRGARGIARGVRHHREIDRILPKRPRVAKTVAARGDPVLDRQGVKAEAAFRIADKVGEAGSVTSPTAPNGSAIGNIGALLREAGGRGTEFAAADVTGMESFSRRLWLTRERV